MVLSLYHLTEFYVVEVNRGRYGIGEYHLHANVQYGSDMPELCPVATPQEINAQVRESGSVPTPLTSSTASLPQAAEDAEPEDTVSDPAVLLTSRERAKDVVERGLITLDPKLAVFTVVGMQEPRLVILFPRLSCWCLATATCYHIMAANMAVGMAVPDTHTGSRERSILHNCVTTNGNEPTRLPSGSSRDCKMSTSMWNPPTTQTTTLLRC